MFDKKEYNRAYYKAHKAEQLARNREWRSKNPDKVKEANHKQYLKRKEANGERTSTESKNIG